MINGGHRHSQQNCRVLNGDLNGPQGIKFKVKVNLSAPHERIKADYRYTSTHLTSALDEDSHLHVPAALPTGKEHPAPNE
jgi:hypothetical protein